MEQNWEQTLEMLLGGFCSEFAQRPSDIEKAKKAISLASKSGITAEQFIKKAEAILEYKKNKPEEYVKIMCQVQDFCADHYL